MSVMTSTTNPPAPVMHGDPDPFVVPKRSHRIGDTPVRSRAVLEGLVVDVTVAHWAGGPVLEVTLTDGTGEIVLAFFGRHAIGGIELARMLTVAGTVGLRDGRRLILNPTYWLHPSRSEAADA